MEKNNKLLNKIDMVIVFFIGLWIGLVVASCIFDKTVDEKDQEIEELKIENAVLKEENQDIMGLWSDLVVEEE